MNFDVPENLLDSIAKLLTDWEEKDKHIVKAFLMGPAARAKLMAVADKNKEIKHELYPVGGILIFVDEIFIDPNTAVPLYKRPKDLRDARKIWAEQIGIALGVKDPWENDKTPLIFPYGGMKR